jgi:hypothetical protein
MICRRGAEAQGNFNRQDAKITAEAQRFFSSEDAKAQSSEKKKYNQAPWFLSSPLCVLAVIIVFLRVSPPLRFSFIFLRDFVS